MSTGAPTEIRWLASLDEARSAVAALIGADASEVIFTSGGTEANLIALKCARDRAHGRERLAY